MFPGRTMVVRLAVALMFGAGLIAVGGGRGDAALRPALAQTAVNSPAADLRLTLDRVLGEHVLIVGALLQKTYDGAPDATAAMAATDANSVDVANTVSTVYGDAAAATFLAGWRRHIQDYLQFTTALKAGDSAGISQADADLQAYANDAAMQLAGLNPNLSVDTVRQALTTHAQQTETLITSYANADYPTVYATAHAGLDHMMMTGAMLADAIVQQFPDRFSGSPDGAAVDLRARLDELLAEHAALGGMALMKLYDHAPDLAAISAAVDQNGQQLSDLVASVYGADNAATFLAGWRQHIQLYQDFTNALAAGDSAGMAAAAQGLNAYAQNAGAFLSSLDPSLSADAVTQLLLMHIQQTETLIQSYAQQDYTTTYMTAAMAADHMFMTGDALAAAIVAEYPQLFT